jgi:putative endonuclease
MKFFCYIIYSSSYDSYYIGITDNISERIEKHNSGFFEKSSTKKSNDWKLKFSIECESIHQAHLIEKHIKKMKSRIYLENLMKYPEICEKLLLKFK